MQGKRGAIVALALLVVVLVCGSLGYRMLSARLEPELAPAPAPAETATPADEPDYPLLADHDPTVYTAGGEAVTLTQIADGRPLVINFWATWCPYCVEELPDFQGIVADYGDRVSFAFVDVTDGGRETVDAAAAFLEENGFTDLPAYYDTELAASIEYGASALPTTVVVNGDGEIVSISAGMIDPVLLRGTLDQMV
ncbi:MAG: TlpA family protein disulfide reductase [Atopobiaceae bacterium]|nr:TlpA family protein disulfide reductase [Atopobiaceae bacterium]